LVVAVALVAIMVSITALSFRGSIENAKLQRAADRLITDLHIVSDQARRDQNDYILTMDTASLVYAALEVTDPISQQPIHVDLTDSDYQIDSINCALAGGESQIICDARGLASPSGQIILSSGSKTMSVIITPGGYIEPEN